VAWLILFPLAVALSYGKLGALGAGLLGVGAVGSVTLGHLLVIEALGLVGTASWRLSHKESLLLVSRLATAGLFVGASWWARPGLAAAPLVGVGIFLFLHSSDRLWFAATAIPSSRSVRRSGTGQQPLAAVTIDQRSLVGRTLRNGSRSTDTSAFESIGWGPLTAARATKQSIQRAER